MPIKLTNEILTAALEGFEAQKTRIDTRIVEIRRMLDGASPLPANAAQPTTGKRTMSAAARKRIAAAQRRRWAAVRKAAAKKG